MIQKTIARTKSFFNEFMQSCSRRMAHMQGVCPRKKSSNFTSKSEEVNRIVD